MRIPFIISLLLLCSACVRPAASEGSVSDIAFRVLGNDTIASTQNVSLLISPGIYSKAVLESFALERQATLCNGPCNVHLYDDSLAFELHRKVLYLEKKSSNPSAEAGSHQEFKAFFEMNHAFIADHFLGVLIGTPQLLWHYPYRELDQIQ